MAKNVRPIVIVAVCAVSVVVAVLLISQSPHASNNQQLEQARVDFAPTIERAQSILDGSADPIPSEERDGKLCLYAPSADYYPDVVRVDATPIQIIDVRYEGEDRAVITVRFDVTRYKADGSRDSWETDEDTWYLQKTNGEWMVYDLYSKP